MTEFWTKKKVAQLEQMVKDGNTFSQIGRQLGCSRNAAVAKAHRMGWRGNSTAAAGWRARKAAEARGEPVPPRKRGAKRPLSAPSARDQAPKGTTPPKKASRVRLPTHLKSDEAFQDLLTAGLQPRGTEITHIPGSRSCKWIDGDVKEGTAVWCRKPVTGGSHWCRHHHGRVYLAGTTYAELKKRRQELKEKNK